MESNKKIIEIILDKLCDVYGRKNNSNLIEFWRIALKEYNPNQIAAAFQGYAKRNEDYKFPTPAYFISFHSSPNPYPYL